MSHVIRLRTALCAALLATGSAPAILAATPDAPAAPTARSDSAEFPALEAVEREVARLVESARPSVVTIIVRSRLAPLLGALGGEVRIEGDTGDGGPIARRIGSGIVIDADGHIATLATLVSGATDVMVIPSKGEKIRARVLGTDDYSGLAVLDLGEAGRGPWLKSVVFADSDALKVGSLVTAFSSPSGHPDAAPVYSFGFVSGMGVSEGPARLLVHQVQRLRSAGFGRRPGSGQQGASGRDTVRRRWRGPPPWRRPDPVGSSFLVRRRFVRSALDSPLAQAARLARLPRSE